MKRTSFAAKALTVEHMVPNTFTPALVAPAPGHSTALIPAEIQVISPLRPLSNEHRAQLSFELKNESQAA